MGEISRRALMLGMAAVGATVSVGAPVLAAADGAVCDEASAWADRLGGMALNTGERLECGWIRMHFGESAFLVSDRFVQATLPCRNGYDVLARGGGRVLLATRKAEHQSGHEHVPVRVIDALRRDHPQSVMKRKVADADARRNARWHSFRADTEGAARIMRFRDDRMMVFMEMDRCEKLPDAREPMWVLLGESWDGVQVFQVHRGTEAAFDPRLLKKRY